MIKTGGLRVLPRIGPTQPTASDEIYPCHHLHLHHDHHDDQNLDKNMTLLHFHFYTQQIIIRLPMSSVRRWQSKGKDNKNIAMDSSVGKDNLGNISSIEDSEPENPKSKDEEMQ